MGQVVGGFVQGMGWVTTEHLHYDENGLLVSHSPSTYKIPNVQDTPRIFNAELVFNEGNVANLRRAAADAGAFGLDRGARRGLQRSCGSSRPARTDRDGHPGDRGAGASSARARDVRPRGGRPNRMSAVSHAYLQHATRLAERGVVFVTVTLVHPEGHVPQDLGAKAIVTAEGLSWGTVGGGRLEARAIEHARGLIARAANASDAPRRN